MNCKPDQICRVVNQVDLPENENRLVTTVSFNQKEGRWEVVLLQPLFVEIDGVVDVLLPAGTDGVLIEDDDLRPLYDGDGQDETLTWKEVPKKVTA